MNTRQPGQMRNLLRDEDGQIIALTAVMMVALCSAFALVVGTGYAMAMQRQLQGSTDAAALAGAGALEMYKDYNTTTNYVNTYSSGTGQYNSSSNLGTVSMMPGSPALRCLSSLQAIGVPCVGAAPYNAVQVKQQAVIDIPLGKFIGHPTVTLTASATAAIDGGIPTPYNIAVILDTTLSMNEYDQDCGNTQMQCSLNGLQALLRDLNPCAAQLTTCTITSGMAASSVDRVSLFTFPSLLTNSTSVDSSCTSPVPNGYSYDPRVGNIVMPPSNPYNAIATATSFWFPIPGAGYTPYGSAYSATTSNNVVTSTYQVLPFMSDFKTADTATSLNSASALVKAAGGVPGCGGLAPPNYAGVYGTYYAAALYQAQSALLSEQAAFPGSQNAIIILSDGDSTAPQTFTEVVSGKTYTYTDYYAGATGLGIYPSWVGQCGQAVRAAAAATAAGTRVFSVAYGSPSTGCNSDAGAGTSPNISPCNTMAAMASAPQYFYSDYKQSGSLSTCVSSQPVTSLNGIFAAIAASLSTPRLIPDNLT